jgi:hypothetical protein
MSMGGRDRPQGDKEFSDLPLPPPWTAQQAPSPARKSFGGPPMSIGAGLQGNKFKWPMSGGARRRPQAAGAPSKFANCHGHCHDPGKGPSRGAAAD